jgi:hypothetical protein
LATPTKVIIFNFLAHEVVAEREAIYSNFSIFKFKIIGWKRVWPKR